VNHIYFVLCMIGILYFSFIYYYSIAKVDIIMHGVDQADK
jgi:hypothetical protein